MNDALREWLDDKTYLMNILSHMGIDVAEVVRCKDCKCYVPIGKNYGKCTYRVREHLLNEPSDYCSYGERKEQENG